MSARYDSGELTGMLEKRNEVCSIDDHIKDSLRGITVQLQA